MTKETGTLAGLNVKPGDVEYRKLVDWNPRKGDVFEDRMGATARAASDTHARIDSWSDNWGDQPFEGFKMDYRIVSRASDTPKTWGEMTDEEKGALLLADHEGKGIQVRLPDSDKWVGVINRGWYNSNAYRVRPPEFKRETVPLYGCGWEWGQASKPCDEDTHRITFDLIDGKPDCASIRMEEL